MNDFEQLQMNESTAPPTRVVFLWHMHQPSYEPPEGGLSAMPWVRLHATRAYRDLAWIFAEHPRVRMVVNFVPCLLDQLERINEGSSDHFRELTRRDPALLATDEKRFLALHFFSCRQETLIDPVPRYRELFGRREAVLSWSAQELLDLQLHFNLAWMGPASRAEQPVVAALLRQGRNFTAAQKEQLLQAQDQVCRQIIPSWRELAARGQVELTTTPYYHPILPLLLDSDVAERAMPGAPLPPRFSWPQDARWQVAQAIRRHQELFGSPPVGLWPAEGSVSPEAVQLIAEQGIRWLATDEGILLRSLPAGVVREEVLYRPYQAPQQGPLILFRDRDLSDRIGFTYGKEPATRAVDDLVGRLEAAGAAELRRSGRPSGGPVILVALDGENPWEGYPDGGVEFLRGVCRRLTEHPRLVTWLPRELDPAGAIPLSRLHTGSWIESTFRIWITGPVENHAWTMLGQARRAVARAEAENHPRWREALAILLPAEGSDWFWWFGDDFSSTQDVLFDGLFRARLRRVYELLGQPCPPELHLPVDQRRRGSTLELPAVQVPAGFIQPTIDGQVTSYYEWAGAVEVSLGGGRAAMYQGERRIARLLYGFSLDHLFLRIDLGPRPASSASTEQQLRLRFHGDPAQELVLPLESPSRSLPATWQAVRYEVGRRIEGTIVEVGIPQAVIGAAPGEAVRLELDFVEDGHVLEQVPGQGLLKLRFPDEDVLSWSWMV